MAKLIPILVVLLWIGALGCYERVEIIFNAGTGYEIRMDVDI